MFIPMFVIILVLLMIPSVWVWVRFIIINGVYFIAAIPFWSILLVVKMFKNPIVQWASTFLGAVLIHSILKGGL